ncbi:MAG TPA: LPXTG cell wall anchor domain-containing protein, partial [Candidatus Saccharibacteria bacterium]|nr:LPXTG cell wall anchor domain-containing protein [Candidatus Saccharibacteria bacterium]
MQEDVPDGYFINDDGDCVSEEEEEEEDVCPNIEGMQEDVPDGYTRDADGNCIILKPTGKLESPKVLPDTGVGSTALTVSIISAIVSGFGYYYIQKRKISN